MLRRWRGTLAHGASRALVSTILVASVFTQVAPAAGSSSPHARDFARGAAAGRPPRDLLILISGRTVYPAADQNRANDPIFRNDILLMPLRRLAGTLGGTVSYAGPREPVMVSRAFRTIFLLAGRRLAKDDSALGFSRSPVAPELHDGVFFVPLRWMAEQLGAAVAWQNARETIAVAVRQSPASARSSSSAPSRGEGIRDSTSAAPRPVAASPPAGPSTLEPAVVPRTYGTAPSAPAVAAAPSASVTVVQATRSPAFTTGGIFNLPTLPPDSTPQPSAAIRSGPSGGSAAAQRKAAPPASNVFLDLLAAPSDATQNVSAMVDFIVFGLLLAVITRLSISFLRREKPTEAFATNSYVTPLYVIGALLFVQFVVIVARPTDTVSSMGRVLPSIMLGIEQIFILLTVIAVVSLGVYLSLRQFALWEAGQRKLLDMADRLTGGDGSPQALSDAPLSSATPMLSKTATAADDGGTPAAAPSLPRSDSSATTIKMSAQGITIVTPLVGLSVLVISLGFLYLFLHWAAVATVR